MMKKSIVIIVLLLVLLVFPNNTSSRHISRAHRNVHQVTQGRMRGNINPRNRPVVKPKGSGPDTVEIAGSSLPDCSHACGSCSPCRLVMVSFVCASLEEAETCPMAYKCMCKNKSYPVP
ncbi:protein EPIDERMAL PATTERNING FACTOR 1 [Amaranthus tricolor]|uniref:protein EPIDERMAL PATTERNING FACTOR 1 n=1 Tax=Amaranthus tricolor TaxID=29722 RepID=UPI0025834A72|nr:protein EPIDERMAL PATTERNING FACTOR 1 [Amaranthus tricolor]